jgi:hypothetical protein
MRIFILNSLKSKSLYDMLSGETSFPHCRSVAEECVRRVGTSK